MPLTADDRLLVAEYTLGMLPTNQPQAPGPSGNLANLLNDILDSRAFSLNGLSDLLGALADIGGAIGTVSLIVGLIEGGQPDQVMQALQTIVDTINHDFQKLNADLAAQQILQRNTTLNEILARAWARLQSLPAAVNAQPPLSSGDRINFISDCLTALDNLSGQVQPDLVWNMDFDWQKYWDDTGTFRCGCNPGLDAWGHDAGYGPQTPTDNGDGTVFVHTYALPLYIWAVSIFLAVGLALDPNFKTNYAAVLKSGAAFLRAKHDQIMAAITPLFPTWIGTGLYFSACPQDHSNPQPGITVQYRGFHGGPKVEAVLPYYVDIRYGAVEKYSGASSIGTFQIKFYKEFPRKPYPENDPAMFNKLQLRVMRRMKDVYVGSGLAVVYQTISRLQELAGEPGLPFPGYGDWSFREVFNVSALPPTSNGFSVRNLATFIINTQDFDTSYTNAPPTTTISVREILTYLPT